MKTALFASVILSFTFLVFCDQEQNQLKQDKIEWIPATINGIVLGKSKYSDIVRLWGKPAFEQEYSPDAGGLQEELQTELSYRNIKIDGVALNAGVIVGDKTRLIRTISLFFEEMSKDEAVRKYGENYYLISSSASTCISSSQKRKKEFGESDYPVEMVYPQKGLSVLVRDDNSVMMVNYSDKCT